MDFNIHNVEADFHEFSNSAVEFILNVLDIGGHLLSFGVTDLNLLELVELNYGVGEVHDILAPLREGIETYKESVLGDFPLIFGLRFVFKI
jgi:hypothetical protein